jgi:hypothetical protein
VVLEVIGPTVLPVLGPDVLVVLPLLAVPRVLLLIVVLVVLPALALTTSLHVVGVCAVSGTAVQTSTATPIGKIGNFIGWTSPIARLRPTQRLDNCQVYPECDAKCTGRRRPTLSSGASIADFIESSAVSVESSFVPNSTNHV